MLYDILGIKEHRSDIIFGLKEVRCKLLKPLEQIGKLLYYVNQNCECIEKLKQILKLNIMLKLTVQNIKENFNCSASHELLSLAVEIGDNVGLNDRYVSVVKILLNISFTLSVIIYWAVI